jgi:hypothetical protein
MLPTFCIENQIREVMERTRLTPTVLGLLTQACGMSGFSQARISLAFSGAKRFEDRKGHQLLELVKEIEQLVQSTFPGDPLLLNDPQQIKSMLDARRAARRLIKDEGYDETTISATAERL